MKRKRLWHIIRKTKVIEEMSGLLLLMLVFALILKGVEPNINTYGDGLWYTFAVVTTIGFGDIAVTSFIGRVLSVILGLYGIINLAVITSVVVNYYQTHHKEL